MVGPVGGAGAGVDDDDIQRLQVAADALQFRLHVCRGNHIAVVEGVEIQFDAGLETSIQGHLFDGDRPLALIHGGMKLIGRVQMGAVVGHQPDPFDGPAFAVGQVFFFQARKKSGHVTGGILMR